MAERAQLDSGATDRLASRSRLAAILALSVFLLLAVLIGRNVLRLNALESQIEQRQSVISALEASVGALKNEAYTLRYAPEDSINVRAHAEAIPGIRENGKQVRDFTIWIDLSTYRKKTLKRVTYRIFDENSPFDSRGSEYARNGFSISYRGTRCINRIAVDVVFEDGSTETIAFDSCKALGQ